MISFRKSLSFVAAAAFLFATSSSQALTITAAGSSLGFSLSTFVSGFTASPYGPLGIAVNSAGQVLVNSYPDRKNYLFKNIDGQTVSDKLSAVSGRGVAAMSLANGSVWQSGGPLARLNNDGTVAALFNNINLSLGMWTNPVNDHIIARGSASGVGSGLLDIDVSGSSPIARRINGASTDGLTVSRDGTTVYTTHNSYDIATGALLSSYSIPGADGMGIISSPGSTLDGQIVVNTTIGNVVLLDPTTLVQTIIANNGSRGDFVAADQTTGTLLLSQTHSIERLSCGSNCAIGSSTVPEPSTLAIMASGLLAMRWRRQQTGKAKN